MKLAAARRFALSLPEATEEPHFDFGSWRVRKKIFATIPSETSLHVPVDENERRVLLDARPDAFEEIVWGARVVPDWVRIQLPHADGNEVCELLEDAWRRRAPKRVLAAFDAPPATHDDLIAALRGIDGLRDTGKVAPAFQLESKAFLHFHGDEADVKYGAEWTRVPAGTPDERKALLDDVRHFVAARG